MHNYHAIKSILPGDDPTAFVFVPAFTYSRAAITRILSNMIAGGRIAVDYLPVLQHLGVDFSRFNIGPIWEPVDRVVFGPVRRFVAATIPANHSPIINFKPTLG